MLLELDFLSQITLNVNVTKAGEMADVKRTKAYQIFTSASSGLKQILQ